MLYLRSGVRMQARVQSDALLQATSGHQTAEYACEQLGAGR